MFVQTWNKYLPVIRILLKRSINADQTLALNKLDFQRAAAGKKVKFSFSARLKNGRVNGTVDPPPLAKDLVIALQQDDVASKFLKQKEFQLSMTSDFQLLIKNTTPVAPPSTNEGAVDADTHDSEEA